MSPAHTPSANLSSLYGDYYKDDKERVWRAIGAKDKADHVLQLCGSLAPETVLEVGCGDGAVLQELDRRGFGKRLYGVEISESGVEATSARNLASLESVQTFSGYELPFEPIQWTS
jgi:SAM-dependent methyltransferase